MFVSIERKQNCGVTGTAFCFSTSCDAVSAVESVN
jgi:hypothetical protein